MPIDPIQFCPCCSKRQHRLERETTVRIDIIKTSYHCHNCGREFKIEVVNE